MSWWSNKVAARRLGTAQTRAFAGVDARRRHGDHALLTAEETEAGVSTSATTRPETGRPRTVDRLRTGSSETDDRSMLSCTQSMSLLGLRCHLASAASHA